MAPASSRFEFHGSSPSSAASRVAATASSAGSRRFKVLVSSHAPRQMSLFALAVNAPLAKVSRTG
jgi:hypothetical protein